MSEDKASIVNILNQARGYIMDPARWTTRSYARKANGDSTSSLSPHAVCWCALGAMNKACIANDEYLTEKANKINTLLNDASFQLFSMGIAEVNDQLGHFQILQVYALAIEMAQP